MLRFGLDLFIGVGGWILFWVCFTIDFGVRYFISFADCMFDYLFAAVTVVRFFELWVVTIVQVVVFCC